jgi:RecB family exonuclease
LLHILRFDFEALQKDFELYGQRDGEAWTLALVPRTEAQRRTIGRITVSGEAAAVRRIELRRSAKQFIEIIIGPPSASAAAFTVDELKRFFR